jgi:hypothetical protein
VKLKINWKGFNDVVSDLDNAEGKYFKDFTQDDFKRVNNASKPSLQYAEPSTLFILDKNNEWEYVNSMFVESGDIFLKHERVDDCEENQ